MSKPTKPRSRKKQAVPTPVPPGTARPTRRGEKRRRSTLAEKAAEGERLARATQEGGVGGALADPRHEAFARAMMNAPNATAAAIRAGWPPNIARQTASRLLTNVDILRRLGELKRKAANQTILRKRDALRLLSVRASATLADFLSVPDVLDDPRKLLEHLRDHPLAGAIRRIKTKDVPVLDGDGPTTKTVISEIELQDGRGCIHELALLLGWYEPEKHRHLHEGQVSIGEALAQVDGKSRGLPAEKIGEPSGAVPKKNTKGGGRWQT